MVSEMTFFYLNLRAEMGLCLEYQKVCLAAFRLMCY